MISKEELELAVAQANSLGAVCVLLNITATVSNYSTIRKNIEKYSISTVHFTNKLGRRDYCNKRIPDSEVFIENSTYAQHKLKERVRKQNLIPYMCECGNKGEWQDEELVLQLDHKNGNRKDHRLQNLRFLCPNCHSQTPTYVARNKLS